MSLYHLAFNNLQIPLSVQGKINTRLLFYLFSMIAPLKIVLIGLSIVGLIEADINNEVHNERALNVHSSEDQVPPIHQRSALFRRGCTNNGVDCKSCISQIQC